jgi:hypothetical protein
MRWLGWVATAASVAVWHAPASAQTPAPQSSYALSWVRGEGAEECPNRKWLASEVERRLGRPVFDVDAERSIEVEVLLLGGQYRSEMFVRDGTGHVLGHRSLQGDEPGCAALANAVALAIALVIDPDALSREQKPASSTAAFELAPRPPEPPPPPSAPEPVPPVAACPKPAAPVAPQPPSLPDTFTRTFFSFRGLVGAGFVPRVAPGAELAFEGVGTRRLGIEVTSTLMPSHPVDRGLGSLDIGMTGARVLLSYELLTTRRARLSAGLGAGVGALHVGVRAPLPVIAPGDYWYAAGDLATKLQVLVGSGIFAELGLVAQVPIVPQKFLVAGQGDAVWGQSLFAGAGFAGVGVLFP